MLACICGGTIETIVIVAASTGLVGAVSNWLTNTINRRRQR